MTEFHVGISQGFHDAGIAVVDYHGDIKFAAHSERTSKRKNDSRLHQSLIDKVAAMVGSNHRTHYYERTWLTNLRRYYAGQDVSWIFDLRQRLRSSGLSPWMRSWSHHLSHAAAAFQTSPYHDAAVIVVDAIGEWDTVSIWRATYNESAEAVYKKLWSKKYPHSLGLFYTAATERIGLRPMEDEYITMGMAAYGTNKAYTAMQSQFVADRNALDFKENLHIGMGIWGREFSNEDIARAAQMVLEDLLFVVHQKARELTGFDHVCYGGGVALNCAFNSSIRKTLWNGAWIMPNPGDCGSSLGAAALGYGKRLNWRDAYLGNEIAGKLNVKDVVDVLLKDGIVGVANGRAEFGPRALGNRSLLADPRCEGIKDRVNDIKRRQRYRPFAPAILSEHAEDYFDVMPGFNYDYMQYAVKATNALEYPAVCHVDGTSRVQTVPRNNSNMRKILEAWYDRTGCPLLLNTSLNIKGQPMVDDINDAKEFERVYDVKVIS